MRHVMGQSMPVAEWDAHFQIRELLSQFSVTSRSVILILEKSNPRIHSMLRVDYIDWRDSFEWLSPTLISLPA